MASPFFVPSSDTEEADAQRADEDLELYWAEVEEMTRSRTKALEGRPGDVDVFGRGGEGVEEEEVGIARMDGIERGDGRIDYTSVSLQVRLLGSQLG